MVVQYQPCFRCRAVFREKDWAMAALAVRHLRAITQAKVAPTIAKQREIAAISCGPHGLACVVYSIDVYSDTIYSQIAC